MNKISGKALDWALLNRIMSYVRPYKLTFWSTAVTTILLAVLSPLRPWLIQYTFDKYILNHNAAMLLNMTVVMIGILMLETIIQYQNTFTTNWLGQTVIKDLRHDVFRHTLNFKLKYFDKTPIGTLVTRSISDIETIADIFSQGLLVIIGDLLKIIAVLGVMFYTDVKLTLISLSTLPVLIFSANIFKNAIKSSFQDVRTEVAKLNSFVQEHVTGMNIVQIFNREEVEYLKFKEINKRHRDANIRSVWHYSIFLPVVEVLSAISIGLLIWWSSQYLLNQQLSLGTIVAFILYLNMLFRPIREMADKFNTLQMGMVSSERVFNLLDTKEQINNSGKIKLTDVKGNIQFKDVWFAYDTDNWILKNLSFQVNPGQKIAFVGATGAGKSSVVNILGRFYEFDKGEIFIDDVDIRKIEISSLRSQIAVVLQDVFLFSDTIANNISLNNSSISRSQIEEAAKIIGAHDFICKLPGGYDFNVNERGGLLSVGQRQLIAFARAYVYNPKILILDEATSSIDTEYEKLIQIALDKITANRTSLIIAHRLSTIQKSDQILVLDQGQIVESGNHQQLINREGYYKKLFDLQF